MIGAALGPLGDQTRVEERHFEFRKSVLKFDDVMNTQRQTIYELRDSILEGEDLKGTIWEMIENTLDDHLETDLPERIQIGKLFHIGLEFERQLDDWCKIVEELQGKFKANGQSPSQNLTPSKKKESEWLIFDEE